MELPLGGPALRHYTQSRPRPHRQKLNYRPSRPQETIIESENEVLELMGRVDEGVEEFFTKRVLPPDTLNKQDEDTITVQEVAPASSVPCPPPTKTLRRKLGDFFTLKKRRGLKSETSQEGRPKKASIADLIRPLREVARSEKDKDKDRVKEHDKENEKGKAKEHPSAVTGESAVQETPVTGDVPLRGETVPPRRALREGKSQSLILLSGSAATGTTNARNAAKKQFEGQHSFEQKLHLMLQRIGVSKPQQGGTQSQEGEMKKAESEGTIIDSNSEPPPTFSKPRTMSASSDTRHQIRASVSAHEAAGKPALPPKPVIKPGPPPTTSGRNTPENELAQIQEAEQPTPTKLSPDAAPSAPAAPAFTATVPPSVPTISNSVPDSASATVSPSNTVAPADTDICTNSVKPTAAATTPTSGTALESKASIPSPSAPTSEPATSTFPSTTTPTQPPSTISLSAISVTSTSETISTTSITTQEAVCAPSSQCSVSTSTNLSLNGALSVNAAPTSRNVTDISDTTTASSPFTSTSDTPSNLSSSVTSISETGDKTTSTLVSSSSVRLISSVPKTTCSPNSSDTITISHDIPITASSSTVSAAISTTTSTSSTSDKTISPTSNGCMNSASPPSATLSHVDISIPSTSSSELKPTDTTPITTSLTHIDAISVSNSASAAAISSLQTTGSEPCSSDKVNASLTPSVSSSLPSDTSGATSHQLTSSALSNDSSGQDMVLQTSNGERAGAEKEGKPTGKHIDEELQMVQNSGLDEPEEKKEMSNNEKKSNDSNGKPALDNCRETRKEAPGESVKAEEVTLNEAESSKEAERSKDEAGKEVQKQEETTPVINK
ncbi:uncharacterized protein LOC133420778 [Cololabis saira]|uniref:uncharacterized protein LOC133420778 n=1 Tax=Cololabis saira TaxID=129043 RepID=UPI002AD48241|nr:uncharacterized protein LOC133420778 [Cololabis saira]